MNLVHENVRTVAQRKAELHCVKDHLVRNQVMKWYSRRMESVKTKATITTSLSCSRILTSVCVSLVLGYITSEKEKEFEERFIF